MDIDNEAEQYLATLESLPHFPAELKPFPAKFRTLYSAKLWFQLTNSILQFLKHPASAPYQVDLFTNFISDFETKINKLRLVEIAVLVSKQYSNANEALQFLQNILTKIDEPIKPDSPKSTISSQNEAVVLATMEVAHYRLMLGEMDKAKEAIDKSNKSLESFDSVEPRVYASFYRVSGDYYKCKPEYGDYYKNSLLYLACINVETELTPPERVSRAHDLAISALLADTIHNFGELLMHPILNSLIKTEFEWLRDILYAFNAGDIGRFEALSPYLPREQILFNSLPKLRQKICLMALIETVFRRPAGDRIIPFATIAAETRMPLADVEHLVMKALSLKLIRGSLDQVSQTAKVTWVQPRVLEKSQVADLRSKLGLWADKVHKVGDMAVGQAPELLAQA